MKAKTHSTVLLVEDDGDLAEMYGLQLRSAGFKIRQAKDAQEALDQLVNHAIDCIVLDVLLPKQNGLGVLHELRTYDDWRQIPVVLLSSLAPAELGLTPALLENLGVSQYLEKAKLGINDLAEAVRAVLVPIKNL